MRYMKGKMIVMYNSNKNVRGMCIIVCTLCETITLNTFAKIRQKFSIGFFFLIILWKLYITSK